MLKRILPATLQLRKGVVASSSINSRKISTFLDSEKRRLVIDTELNSAKEEFPWVWLRDNCQCSSCYEPLAQSRIVNLSEFDQKVKPVKCQVTGGQVEVEWEDKHLRPEQREKFSESVCAKTVLWPANFQENYPTADFNSIMTDDSALLSWLEDLDKHGFVLVRNVPIKQGPVHELQARSGFHRLTHYGEDYVVKIKADPSNLAYTHHRIFFHTDSPFYEHMPGVAYLHCIEQHQGEGGETMLADGFKAAAILKETHPEKYSHNARGELVKINWNHFTRDSYFDVDIDQVEEFYTAMRCYDDILNDAANHIKLKMEPGDMVTTKNLVTYLQTHFQYGFQTN